MRVTIEVYGIYIYSRRLCTQNIVHFEMVVLEIFHAKFDWIFGVIGHLDAVHVILKIDMQFLFIIRVHIWKFILMLITT